MKNQTNQLSTGRSSEVHAQKAIESITKWVEERYPRITALTRERLIAQCLIEIKGGRSSGSFN